MAQLEFSYSGNKENPEFSIARVCEDVFNNVMGLMLQRKPRKGRMVYDALRDFW